MNRLRGGEVEYTYERIGDIGLFNLNGDLVKSCIGDLKVLLMRAVYADEKAVINLRNVQTIDMVCLNLLRDAYWTSIRLRKPIIITEVPERYIEHIRKNPVLKINKRGG